MMTAAILVTWLLTLLLAVGSLLSFSKLSYGAIRGLAFPREQFFLVSLLLIPAHFLLQDRPWAYWGAGLSLAVMAIQLAYIVKFTPLWRKQSLSATEEERKAEAGRISLLAANVKKSNRAYSRLIDLVQKRQPDVVMAIEIDDDWLAALKKGLENHYPHWVDVPLDNGYGLCLMSRLPLSETEVRELIMEGVPSIKTAVTLRDGRALRLYVIHPEPPVIDQTTRARDSEIAQVGFEALNDRLPAIVSGDLNDVAWSTTTRLFQRLSQLLDPRVGRGFYNTFSATMPWMRWPLDHLFHDARFRLISMERLEKIGSDHFPMWFELALANDPAKDISPGQADAEEQQETKKMIREERADDREPVGTDWED